MNSLNYRCFVPSKFRRLCENLNNIVGQDVWYDTFKVHNRKWLWPTNDLVTTLNSDKVLFGSFCLYPCHVADILNPMKEIHLYVLCSENKITQIMLKNVLPVKSSVTYRIHTGDYFVLSSCSGTIALSMEERQFPNLPSELIFAQCVKKKSLIVSSVRYCLHQQTCDIYH